MFCTTDLSVSADSLSVPYPPWVMQSCSQLYDCNSGSHPLPLLPVVCGHTHTHTHYIRNHSRGLVTSWANLWLLHCHIKNENQCSGLRELAALLNSEMTLECVAFGLALKGPVNRISSERDIAQGQGFPCRQVVNVNWGDKAAELSLYPILT